MEKKKIHYAWWTLLALCIIVGIGKGSLSNSASLFLTPITKDLGVGLGSLSLYFSVSAIVTLIFLPIGGKILAKYDIRSVLIVGIILQAGSYVLFSFMSSVWGWYIMAIPLAVGGVFITVIAGPVLINQWFKKNSGLALGILGAAGGLLGAISQPIVGKLISSHGWRSSYVIVGIAAMVIIIPVVLLLIKKSPQAKGLLPYGMDEAAATDNGAAINTEEKGVTFAIAKKSSAFYALLIFFFLVTSIASFSMHIPTYLMNKGFSVSFAGNIMGTLMIGVLIGSLIIGFLTDRIGSKNTALLAMAVGLISICLLVFTESNAGIITLAVGLFGVISSSIGTLGPALTASLFGNKEYSQIYSTASLGLAISSIVALPVYGYVYDFTGSYTVVLYALLAMLVINIIAILFAFKGKKKLEQDGFWK
ncbi:MFS transporter [Rummeliibacillus stabekisii]|uniref:MFS transporter n=1 Tax=Rummeliibacillus stabekisii TaxID=241244 RepID=UPI00116A311B|nr:MFS transporter [Rummeliibacillus stabekisii]MBB5171217.1 MFS family permease [Rummeliibacillus stabekisii]GEL06080.1 phosphoglycerate transporter [Rummeliibacillus stabekisii]